MTGLTVGVRLPDDATSIGGRTADFRVTAAPGGAVRTFKLIALVVLVAMVTLLVQPARAEAIDPMTAVAIAGVAVAVIIIVAVVVIANMRERERGSAAVPMALAYDTGGVQGQ